MILKFSKVGDPSFHKKALNATVAVGIAMKIKLNIKNGIKPM